MADSTSWYETPTGILVPIPPIAGAGGDVGAPAAPAAPAPAPSADSASAPTAPAAPTSDGGDLVDFMLKTFRSGPMRYRMEAAHWLTERGFGRAPQVVEHVGEEGGPIHVKVTWGEMP